VFDVDADAEEENDMDVDDKHIIIFAARDIQEGEEVM
jgi:SET domain-containing protein